MLGQQVWNLASDCIHCVIGVQVKILAQAVCRVRHVKRKAQAAPHVARKRARYRRMRVKVGNEFFKVARVSKGQLVRA